MDKKSLKILAIDDMPANLLLLGQTLQDEYSIQIATSGAEGLALAREEPPDLILLDIMMPDMDGYQICHLIKADSSLKDIPIIFVTALNDVAAETRGLAAGAADYLSKPINIEIARLRIGNLLEREQMRRQLQRRDTELRLAASVFANTHDGIVITDAENRILDVNAAFCRITGYPRQEVLGKNPGLLKSGRHTVEFYRGMWHSLLHHENWKGEIWNRNKNGEIYAALTSISVVRDEQGNIHHYIGSFADITPLKQHEFDLERIAHYDPLTGIPNRLLLADRLVQAIRHTRRSQNYMAVCYLDLDGFKPVNDLYGHDVGDELLIEVSRRLKDCLRAGDTVARIGGDEFVLLLLDISSMEECRAILERILSKVAQYAWIDGHQVVVSASLGYTLFPNDQVDADALLRHADQAMYVAKQSGKNRCHLFDPDFDRIALERGEALAQIETAIGNNEFVLYFQPKVNMRTGRILGAEGLIRWCDPVRNLLLPAEFLPAIEGSALTITLGDWVLDEAFKQMQAFQQRSLQLNISVNVSPHQLLHPDFVAGLQARFDAYPLLNPANLELEILETAALENIGQISVVMNACRKLGVSFALDDFGTGYSSLTYLKALPAETLKIDLSFIRDMLCDQEDLAIVAGIINLSATFHRQVIAEGVESVGHGLQLLKLGCDHAQGYGIAKPMPAAQLVEWMENWRPYPEWSKQGEK